MRHSSLGAQEREPLTAADFRDVRFSSGRRRAPEQAGFAFFEYQPHAMLSGLSEPNARGRYSGYDKERYVLPSPELLGFLKENKPKQWNQLKQELLSESPGKKLYLRGVDLEHGVDLRNYDMTRCDMVDAVWPRNPTVAMPKSLTSAVVLSEKQQREEQDTHLSLALRRRVQEEKLYEGAVMPSSEPRMGDGVRGAELHGLLVELPSCSMAI